MHMKMFRAQRNMYLTGLYVPFNLFLEHNTHTHTHIYVFRGSDNIMIR
jgi:hypothetical protein